jgi:8-oxo-dGTP pyrophosphatase MutT (NUDIX family)
MIRHFTASAIVLDDFDQVLLVEHSKMGLWLYPGGHLDPNEDPAQAVLREVREEVRIQVEIIAEHRFEHPSAVVVPSPFTILVQDVNDSKFGLHQHIDMIYVCRPLSADIVHQPEELRGCRWVPCAEVSAFATPPELPSLIAEAAGYARRQRTLASPQAGFRNNSNPS